MNFTKDTTGITFTLPSTDMKVFFDGYTAIVTGTGNLILSGQNLHYLVNLSCLLSVVYVNIYLLVIWVGFYLGFLTFFFFNVRQFNILKL